MRKIYASRITDTVARLCIEANCYLNDDIKELLKEALAHEESDISKGILKDLLDNAEIASRMDVPMCQDTGMTVVFAEVGQDVHIVDGDITNAINEGVRKGYNVGYLRKSVVDDPLLRRNTGDNTPAIIYYDIVEGDSLKITVVPKGFGSENMSALKMLKPSDGVEGVKNFIVDTVRKAGPNPCPPIVVGVGIGGTMEKAAILAKRALLRPINQRNDKEHVRNLELEVLDCINQLGIGPAGLGGKTTALGVNIEVYPTHIAGLPVAVNISCHATRHREAII